MKKCTKCGTVQSDNVKICIDCNEPLGKPLSYHEAKQILAGDLSEYFNVSTTDKVIILLHLIGLLFSIMSITNLYDEHTALLSSRAVIFFIIGAIYSAFPKAIWKHNISRFRMYIRNVDDIRPTSYFITWIKAPGLLTLIMGYVLLIPRIIKFFK